MINGDTKDLKLDSVLIQYINSKGKIVQESYPVGQGKFSVKGFITQPTFSYLIFKNKGEIIDKKEMELKRTVAYLSPGTMTVTTTTTPATGEFLEIQGSKTQDEWKELSQKTKGLTGAQLAKISYDYFSSHPGPFVTADRIKYFTSVFSLNSIKLLYEHFPIELKESMDVKRLAAEIKSREIGILGIQAYRFNVKDKDNKELSLEKGDNPRDLSQQYGVRAYPTKILIGPDGHDRWSL